MKVVRPMKLLFLLICSPFVVAAQDLSARAEMAIQFDLYRVAELKTAPIDFGTVLIGGDGGTVALDASGGATYTGGVLGVTDGPSGRPEAGTLTLEAADGLVATIDVSSSVDLGEGLRFRPVLDSHSVRMTGSAVIVKVYGTLEIPSDAPAGSYDGTLVVDVSYN